MITTVDYDVSNHPSHPYVIYSPYVNDISASEFPNNFLFEESSRPFHITIPFENAPQSYFEQATSVKFENPITNKTEVIDEEMFSTFRKYKFNEDSFLELAKQGLSLKQAFRCIKEIEQNFILTEKTTPSQIVQLISCTCSSAYKRWWEITYENIISWISPASLPSRIMNDVKNIDFFEIYERYLNIDKDNREFISGEKRVFTLDDHPGLIFKIISHYLTTDIEYFFLSEHLRKSKKAMNIINKYNLNLLKVPESIHVHLGREKKPLIIQEKISTEPGAHLQDLFTKYGDKLNLAIRQLVTFILKNNGFISDFHAANLLIVDPQNEQGNHQIALIDLDGLGDTLGFGRSTAGSSLFGKIPNLVYPNTFGLLPLLTVEQIDVMTDQIVKILGKREAHAFFEKYEFEKLRKARIQKIAYEKARDQYIKEKGSTPLQEFPTLTLHDIGIYENDYSDEIYNDLAKTLQGMTEQINETLKLRAEKPLKEPWANRVCHIQEPYSRLILDKLKESGVIFEFSSGQDGFYIQL